MKRYLSNFKLTENFILESMLECLSHKTKNIVRWNRKDTSYFLADYYIKGGFAELKNIHEAANFIHNDIHNNFTFYHDVLAPYIARKLFLEIKNRNIQLSPINYQERVDPSSGKIREAIMNEALKYQGWKYVYGGSNPNTSFDCSGLVQWCYGKAGISLPRTAQAQYDATQHFPLSQAKAGDLVFFHSTYNAGTYVTHVGILVSPTQMYHAGNPIGYADLNNSYWQQHLIGAGRVK